MKKMSFNTLITAGIVILIASGCKEIIDNNPKKLDVTPENVGSYSLLWEDLFSGNTLDESKWGVEVNGDGGGNSELQYYTRESITVGAEPATNRNCLIITARKQQYNGKPATSGRLNTNHKFNFKYGKMEASIKLPKTANGLWPAFWMMGHDRDVVGWPRCGEIDILEMGKDSGIVLNLQERYFNGACHWGPSWNGGAYPMYALHRTSDYSLQDDFHLYTLIWDENKIKMYLDLDRYPNNQPYYEMNINDHSSITSPGAYFNKEFFIIFNLAVGGKFPGIYDINNVTALNGGPARMYVDFVKVYRRD